jgi:hypothetical protein
MLPMLGIRLRSLGLFDLLMECQAHCAIRTCGCFILLPYCFTNFPRTTYKRIGGPPNPNEPRPPPFPAALRALLASPLARKKASMKVQPDEPAALSLALDKRGWLGKLPERRERNLWWNWWREEPTKTLVPAEIEVIDEAMNSTVIPSLKSTDELGGPGAGNNVAHGSDSRTLSASLHLRQLGLPVARTQETGLIRRAEVYARNRIVPNPPRRSVERITGSGERNHQEPETTPLAIPPQSRFVRRRYRDLLSKMPLLTFKPAPSLHTPTTHAPGTTNEYQQASPSPLPTTLGKFNVTISPIATTQGPRNRVTYSLMSQEDREWIERARHIKNPTTPGNGQTSIHSKNT